MFLKFKPVKREWLYNPIPIYPTVLNLNVPLFFKSIAHLCKLGMIYKTIRFSFEFMIKYLE